jgi:hypothetical protein
MIYKDKRITKSYKLSYEPVKKGVLFWKRTEYSWIVVRSAAVCYKECPDAPDYVPTKDSEYIVNEEDVVKVFHKHEKHKAVEMLINLNKELTCQG